MPASFLGVFSPLSITSKDHYDRPQPINSRAHACQTSPRTPRAGEHPWRVDQNPVGPAAGGPTTPMAVPSTGTAAGGSRRRRPGGPGTVTQAAARAHAPGPRRRVSGRSEPKGGVCLVPVSFVWGGVSINTRVVCYPRRW